MESLGKLKDLRFTWLDWVTDMGKYLFKGDVFGSLVMAWANIFSGMGNAR